MSAIEQKDDKWMEHEIHLRILAFQSSDLYKRADKSNTELKQEIKSSYHHLDNKITGIYAVMAAFFIAWYFNGHIKPEEAKPVPSNSTQLKTELKS